MITDLNPYKDRPEALRHQIRYDRAVLYDHVDRKAQARREFERVYAEDPEFDPTSAVGGLRRLHNRRKLRLPAYAAYLWC